MDIKEKEQTDNRIVILVFKSLIIRFVDIDKSIISTTLFTYKSSFNQGSYT